MIYGSISAKQSNVCIIKDDTIVYKYIGVLISNINKRNA